MKGERFSRLCRWTSKSPHLCCWSEGRGNYFWRLIKRLQRILNALPGCECRWKMQKSACSRVLIERPKNGKDLLPLCRHIGMNCEGSWPAADNV